MLGRLAGHKLPVFINSGGGSIEAAFAIGDMIREHGLSVSVTRTEFLGCHHQSKACARSVGHAAGSPNSFDAYCASACTLVLAAGVINFGLHSAHLMTNDPGRQSHAIAVAVAVAVSEICGLAALATDACGNTASARN